MKRLAYILIIIITHTSLYIDEIYAQQATTNYVFKLLLGTFQGPNPYDEYPLSRIRGGARGSQGPYSLKNKMWVSAPILITSNAQSKFCIDATNTATYFRDNLGFGNRNRAVNSKIKKGMFSDANGGSGYPSIGVDGSPILNRYYKFIFYYNDESEMDFAVLMTKNNPVTIQSANTKVPQPNITKGMNIVANIVLSGNPGCDENVMIRYSTDNWATAYFASATGSGRNYTATIHTAGLDKGAMVSYYACTSVSTSPNKYDFNYLMLNQSDTLDIAIKDRIVTMNTQPSINSITELRLTTQPKVNVQDADTRVGLVGEDVKVVVNDGFKLKGDTVVQTNNAGIATFQNLSIKGEGKAILTFISGLKNVSSIEINVQPNFPQSLVLKNPPPKIANSNKDLPQILNVVVMGTENKVLNGQRVTVTPTNSKIKLSGTLTVTTDGNGVASFKGLKVNGSDTTKLKFTLGNLSIKSDVIYVDVPQAVAAKNPPPKSIVNNAKGVISITITGVDKQSIAGLQVTYESKCEIKGNNNRNHG